MNCPTANVPQKGARFYAEMIALAFVQDVMTASGTS